MKSAIPAGIAGLICIVVGIASYHQGDTLLYLNTLLLDGALYLIAAFVMLQGSKDGYATAIRASQMLFFTAFLRVMLGFPGIAPRAMSGLALLSGGYYYLNKEDTPTNPVPGHDFSDRHTAPITAAMKSPHLAAVMGFLSLANGVHSYFFRGGTLINIVVFTMLGALYVFNAWDVNKAVELVNLGANNNYNNHNHALYARWRYDYAVKLTHAASLILCFYAGVNTASGYPDDTYPVFLMMGVFSALYYKWGSGVNERATNPPTPTPAPVPVPVPAAPAPASIAETQ